MNAKMLLGAYTVVACVVQASLIVRQPAPARLGGEALVTFVLLLLMKPILRVSTWWHGVALAATLSLVHVLLSIAVPGDDWQSIRWLMVLAVCVSAVALMWRRRHARVKDW